MAFIAHNFIEISKTVEETIKFIKEHYQVNSYESDAKVKLAEFLSGLRKDLKVFIEHPYVDKVFRDSYYFYFSTKHKLYPRDCIRLSFFQSDVEFDHLYDAEENQNYLQDRFVGYCVIRPTFPDIIGRNLISKKALIRNEFITCIHDENVLVNGIKLAVSGYPHSSQDQESISCAETTIWALMEYFGHKYAEYRPVLPSNIINKLNERSDKRMLPSNGLTIDQISYALKDFGFGTLIYTRDDDKSDFFPSLSVYIESGIPVIVAIENTTFAHAILMIGREQIKKESLIRGFRANRRLIPFSSIVKKYVIQDDNLPPYSLIPLNKPSVNYDLESGFQSCRITSFVVPLYRKMYMEAKKANNFMISIFTDIKYGSNTKQKHIFRMYLASSRSFKSHIAKQTKMNSDLRQYLLAISMPKFIYCGEFISARDVKVNQVSSLIVLDATEACENWEDSFIFASHKKRSLFPELFKNVYKIFPIEIPFSGFTMYSRNLN